MVDSCVSSAEAAPITIAMIAAVAANGGIGINGGLPWHLPGDLQYFKAMTLGKPVIMGRKTFESLPNPLAGRTNIVITRDRQWQHEGVVAAYSIDEAIALATSIAQRDHAEEIMVIGGAQIYQQAFASAIRLYLTQIDAAFEADTFFPAFDKAQWHEVKRQDIEANQTKQIPAFSYLVLEKTD